MQIILLSIHVIVTVMLILIILAQRTTSDGLSGLSSSGSNSGIVSGRTAKNILTTITYTLAITFMITSLLLARGANKSASSQSIIDSIDGNSKVIDKSPSVPIAE